MRNFVMPNSARSRSTVTALRACVVMVAAVLPMGCASDIEPITWLHNQEGGAIAQDRPDMPQSDAPYPNLASVPAKPALPDNKAREAIGKGLIADRTNAQYTLSTEIPVASAAPPAAAAPAPSLDEAAGASLQAASSPKPASTPVKIASATPRTVSDAVPVPAALTGPQKVMQPMREARPAEAVSSLPELAEAPPPPPQFAGVAANTVPTPPPPAPANFVPPSPPSSTPQAVAPPAPAAMGGTAPAPAASATNLHLGFPPGSSTLPGAALAALKAFAHERGVRSMVVTGFGDVASSDAAAQAAGLTLALQRARSVAAYLMAVGVPPTAVRITGQAQGQGAAIRLVN